MERLIKLVREMTGIIEEVKIRDFTIRVKQNEATEICVDLQVVPPFLQKVEAELSRTIFTNAEQPQDVIIKGEKKKMGRPVTRVKPKLPAPEKKDRLDVTRTFSTTEDDIKLVRTFMYSWRKDAGTLTEDQLRALKPTDGRHVGGLSMIERQQILDIFNDVRKKKGLIK